MKECNLILPKGIVFRFHRVWINEARKKTLAEEEYMMELMQSD